jgi:hypothetical protein
MFARQAFRACQQPLKSVSVPRALSGLCRTIELISDNDDSNTANMLLDLQAVVTRTVCYMVELQHF